MFSFFLNIYIWVINLFKVGDLVSRISHGNDVVFKIAKIIDNKAYLTGINVRLCADSDLEDLILVSESDDTDEEKFYEKLETIRNFERGDYFDIPGKILHIDGDREYLNRGLEF